MFYNEFNADLICYDKSLVCSQDACKFKAHGKRKKLLPIDFDNALRMRNMEVSHATFYTSPQDVSLLTCYLRSLHHGLHALPVSDMMPAPNRHWYPTHGTRPTVSLTLSLTVCFTASVRRPEPGARAVPVHLRRRPRAQLPGRPGRGAERAGVRPDAQGAAGYHHQGSVARGGGGGVRPAGSERRDWSLYMKPQMQPIDYHSEELEVYSL